MIRGYVPIFSMVSILFLEQLQTTSSQAPCAEITTSQCGTSKNMKEECWPIEKDSLFFIKYDVSPTATNMKQIGFYIFI